MCGIVGSIHQQPKLPEDVLNTIRHRGPDSEGYFQKDEIFLGHTRLSIQDLSSNGNQPMFSQDGNYVIIFNGEIYNHQEIREQYFSDFKFISSGDTETVLQAYIHYGADCLSMFNGIFALAIYNIKDSHIFIARDHFGVKPLYLYRDTDKLLFGSEIKSFLEFNIDRTLEPLAFSNYLTFLWSPGELTPFEKVTKLLPGHYLSFHVNDFRNAKSVSYYVPKFNGKYGTQDEEVLINELDEKLTKAVKRQLLSDVPVGFFLSGGLDSTLIVAIARKLFPEREFPCFTISTPSWKEKNDGFADDLEYAKKAAKLLRVDLHIVESNSEILSSFDEMVKILDEPQADPAPLHVLNISLAAREKGIKVLLGGTAGDDLFSGYRRHQALAYEKYFILLPSFFRRAIATIARQIPVKNAYLRRVKKILADIDKDPLRRLANYFRWLPDVRVMSLFSKEWQKKLNGFDPTDYLLQLSDQIPEERSALNHMLYWEIKAFLVDHNLNYTDKMSMAVGVETRVPFLDLELVEFALRLPPDFKIKNGETKYLLKKVAERYLPNEIIYRPKTGFGAPVRKWIVEEMEDMINTRLSSERLRHMGIFDPAEVHRLIEDNKKGKVDASYTIWALLAIDSWILQFYSIEAECHANKQ